MAMKKNNVVMPMYNLIENSDAQTSRELWQYCRNEPALDDNGNIIDFPTDDNSDSLKFKQKIMGQTGNRSAKDVETMVP